MIKKSPTGQYSILPSPHGVSLIGPPTQIYSNWTNATSAYFMPMPSGMQKDLLLSLALDIVIALKELVHGVIFEVQNNMIQEPSIVAQVSGHYRQVSFHFVQDGILVMEGNESYHSVTLEYADPTMIDQMATYAATLLNQYS